MGNELSIRSGIDSIKRQVESALNKPNIPNNGMSFFVARVTYVLLDDTDKERFSKYGGWKGIGTIECKTFINNELNEDIIFATPVNPNTTLFPVINEVVLIFRSITYKAQKDENNFESQYYYSNVIPVWNSPEHNAVPNKKTKSLDTGTFKATGKVKRIIKSPGDMSVEGRSGNLIRLGSYVKDFNSPFKGVDRSPLLTIVNGIRDTTDSKIAIYEDINLDGSSLYMMAGQNVSFRISSINYDSFKYKIDQNISSNYIEPVQITSSEPDKLEEIVDTPVAKKEVIDLNKKEPARVDSISSQDESELLPNDFAEDAFDLTDGDIVPYNAVDELSIEVEEALPEYKRPPEANTIVTTNPPRTPKQTTRTGTGEVKIEKPLTENISSNIKWELQQSRTWCYVACVSMVLKSYNISSAIQSTVATCNDKNGNLRSETAAKKFGVSFRKTLLPSGKVASYNAIVKTCQERTSNGKVKPFILERLGSSGNKSHFVVVVGLTADNRVLLYDPGSRKNSAGSYLSIKNLKETGGTLRFFD